jgi:hypothetical protein
MKALSAASALVMALLPAAALSQGCDRDRTSIKLSCAEGTNWDDTSKRCVPVVGS